MKILLVEDEEEISLFIKKGLEANFFVVDVAENGNEGEKLGMINSYDVIILDYNIPEKNGLELCKIFRKKGKTFPIIMLTAESDIEKKVEAFSFGANDYMTKPFAIEELIARIKSLGKSSSNIENLDTISYDDLTIDLKKYIIKRADKEIDLRKKEFILLEYFMRNPGTVLTRSMILEHVWDTNADPFTNTVDVHIRTLRKKINDGFDKKLIDTIRGIGYRL